MKPNRVTVALLERMVEKSIQDAKENPQRSLRNLIDLGERLTNGRNQKVFFSNAQAVLHDKKSVYYEITSQVIQETDTDTLKTFGVRLGYNCWSFGANYIRNAEARAGHNIPWTLYFDFSDGAQKISPEDIHARIQEGKELGIFFYMFRIGPGYTELDALIRMLAKESACAYLLLLPPEFMTEALALRISIMRSACVAVDANGPSAEEAFLRLKQARCLYGGFVEYVGEAPEEQWLSRAHEEKLPMFFFLRKGILHGAHSPAWQVGTMRQSLKIPVMPMDLFEDIAMVDRRISSEACVAAIYGDGSMQLVDMEARQSHHIADIQKTTLRTILRELLVKERISGAVMDPA